MSFLRPRALLHLFLGSALLVPAPWCQARQAEEPAAAEASSGEATEQKLDRLIAQLGAEEYASRQAARQELERMGLDAFDALFAAQDHADIEIALAARFLIRSVEVKWSREEDPEEVRRILSDYSSQTNENRRSLMQRLAELENGMGIAPLCRIARYESDGSLSKHAAILLLEVERPADAATAQMWAAVVNDTLDDSARSAAEWGRAYAETLVDPAASLATWDRLIRSEHATLLSHPEKTDRNIVRQLMRWQTELLLELERREDAVAVMRRTIGLLDKDRRQLIDWIDWLILHDAPQLVEEIADQFAETFFEDPELIYRLAETKLQQGLTEEANTAAGKAQAIQPQNIFVHYRLASTLRQRELFDWAEQEYRVVIENAPVVQAIKTRITLSEMLHDIQKDKAAAEALEEVLMIAASTEEVRQALANSERTLGEIRSRMNFFFAEHAKASENLAEVKDRLLKGLAADPRDVDLLIAMYRLKTDDPEWKKTTTEALQAAIAHYRNEIAKYEKLATTEGPRNAFQDAEALWAMACNQYAWLVANTEGDFDDAVKQSHQSLKLMPDSSSYLDTLGRCYYAAGDLKNAIKYQRRAAAMEPYLGQIRRQLELFESEWEKKYGTKPPAGQEDTPARKPTDNTREPRTNRPVTQQRGGSP